MYVNLSNTGEKDRLYVWDETLLSLRKVSICNLPFLKYKSTFDLFYKSLLSYSVFKEFNKFRRYSAYRKRIKQRKWPSLTIYETNLHNLVSNLSLRIVTIYGM